MPKFKNKLKYSKTIVTVLSLLVSSGIVFVSNLALQLSQNELSWDLATKFAFDWHTEKFILGCLVLAVFLLFWQNLLGSTWFGLIVYSLIILLIGTANYLKMFYRTEPLYPDDLKMITEVELLSEMVGWPLVLLGLALLSVIVGLIIWQIYRSRRLTKKQQLWRAALLIVSVSSLLYISQFNQPNNILRKAYNRSAKWIPYSQKMNYYNTGFMGGFLYNLAVEPMTKPEGYSKESVMKVIDSVQAGDTPTTAVEDNPNIVFIMSESFSDPSRLNNIVIPDNPLKTYQELAEETYSGRMLSQNYGGGTANIEFEALTSLSMEPFNGQLTTPYTMLVPKLSELPSIVSMLENQDYETTAVHPYNTSMYKRKDVYRKLGFDTFLSEESMTHQDKIQANQYISDESAFAEVLDKLVSGEKEQFVHLVTMQTHMPYREKYGITDPLVSGVANPLSISSYLTDVGYTSEALKEFLNDLQGLDRRTLVVFWGDHLPSIYGDDIKESNDNIALHQTEFAFFDSEGEFESNGGTEIMSPIYFAPKLFELAGLQQSGFYLLLNQLAEKLPAFEKQMYYQEGRWHETMVDSPELSKLYEDYLLIQYDLVAGQQYSLASDFYKNNK